MQIHKIQLTMQQNFGMLLKDTILRNKVANWLQSPNLTSEKKRNLSKIIEF